MMKEISNYKEPKKSIKIFLTEAEHQKISDAAKQMKYSISKYTKLKTLDDAAGVEQRSRQIMQLMPVFYGYVEDVTDPYTRPNPMEIGGQICQLLK